MPAQHMFRFPMSPTETDVTLVALAPRRARSVAVSLGTKVAGHLHFGTGDTRALLFDGSVRQPFHVASGETITFVPDDAMEAGGHTVEFYRNPSKTSPVPTTVDDDGNVVLTVDASMGTFYYECDDFSHAGGTVVVRDTTDLPEDVPAHVVGASALLAPGHVLDPAVAIPVADQYYVAAVVNEAGDAAPVDAPAPAAAAISVHPSTGQLRVQLDTPLADGRSVGVGDPVLIWCPETEHVDARWESYPVVAVIGATQTFRIAPAAGDDALHGVTPTHVVVADEVPTDARAIYFATASTATFDNACAVANSVSYASVLAPANGSRWRAQRDLHAQAHLRDYSNMDFGVVVPSDQLITTWDTGKQQVRYKGEAYCYRYVDDLDAPQNDKVVLGGEVALMPLRILRTERYLALNTKVTVVGGRFPVTAFAVDTSQVARFTCPSAADFMSVGDVFHFPARGTASWSFRVTVVDTVGVLTAVLLRDGDRLDPLTDSNEFAFAAAQLAAYWAAVGQTADLAPADTLTLAVATDKNNEEHGSRFVDCSFDNILVANVTFDGAEFTNCSFAGATLENVHFTACAFVKCSFNDADMGHALRDDVTFTECTFDACDEWPASCRRVRFDECTFTADCRIKPDDGGNHWIEAGFRDCSWTGDRETTFFPDGCDLRGADFGDTSLGSDVLGKHMLVDEHTNFGDNDMKDAALRNTSLDETVDGVFTYEEFADSMDRGTAAALQRIVEGDRVFLQRPNTSLTDTLATTLKLRVGRSGTLHLSGVVAQNRFITWDRIAFEDGAAVEDDIAVAVDALPEAVRTLTADALTAAGSLPDSWVYAGQRDGLELLQTDDTDFDRADLSRADLRKARLGKHSSQMLASCFFSSSRTVLPTDPRFYPRAPFASGHVLLPPTGATIAHLSMFGSAVDVDEPSRLEARRSAYDLLVPPDLRGLTLADLPVTSSTTDALRIYDDATRLPGGDRPTQGIFVAPGATSARLGAATADFDRVDFSGDARRGMRSAGIIVHTDGTRVAIEFTERAPPDTWRAVLASKANVQLGAVLPAVDGDVLALPLPLEVHRVTFVNAVYPSSSFSDNTLRLYVQATGDTFAPTVGAFAGTTLFDDAIVNDDGLEMNILAERFEIMAIDEQEGTVDIRCIVRSKSNLYAAGSDVPLRDASTGAATVASSLFIYVDHGDRDRVGWSCASDLPCVRTVDIASSERPTPLRMFYASDPHITKDYEVAVTVPTITASWFRLPDNDDGPITFTMEDGTNKELTQEFLEEGGALLRRQNERFVTYHGATEAQIGETTMHPMVAQLWARLNGGKWVLQELNNVHHPMYSYSDGSLVPQHDAQHRRFLLELRVVVGGETYDSRGVLLERYDPLASPLALNGTDLRGKRLTRSHLPEMVGADVRGCDMGGAVVAAEHYTQMIVNGATTHPMLTTE